MIEAVTTPEPNTPKPIEAVYKEAMSHVAHAPAISETPTITLDPELQN